MKSFFVLLLSFLLLLTACGDAAVAPAKDPTREDTAAAFDAVVLDVQGSSVLVMPFDGEAERRTSDRISFGIAHLDGVTLSCGDAVTVHYNGEIAESYPAQIRADAVKQLAVCDRKFPATWIETASTTVESDLLFTADVIITQTYADCFFAEYVVPSPYIIKINSLLPERYCLGDTVRITLGNVKRDEERHRIEGALRDIAADEVEFDPLVCAKPVIYLYPEAETAVSVALDLQGELTCTYPAYRDGWRVTAAPDGTLTDEAGQTYTYLYWEGEASADWDLSRGFCIRGEETAAFLETALSALGLTRREANEFIVYWLPLMQDNPYNLITFQTAAYESAADLRVTPTPDTVLRVFMAYVPLDAPVDIPAQPLDAPARDGFTVVEWGGTVVCNAF